eukprot:TRINITY_DN67778_c12_g1_i1.p1 TRINITY_DN67778_c12_g1~~TRINITY_DN67778_c12_g1_i1.p1  ORF type:complete len:228 (+),score=21.92 TRINITY_DN67778_c12_g1_i1:3-686(+)
MIHAMKELCGVYTSLKKKQQVQFTQVLGNGKIELRKHQCKFLEPGSYVGLASEHPFRATDGVVTWSMKLDFHQRADYNTSAFVGVIPSTSMPTNPAEASVSNLYAYAKCYGWRTTPGSLAEPFLQNGPTEFTLDCETGLLTVTNVMSGDNTTRVMVVRDIPLPVQPVIFAFGTKGVVSFGSRPVLPVEPVDDAKPQPERLWLGVLGGLVVGCFACLLVSWFVSLIRR